MRAGWDKTAAEKFEQMVAKVPVFLRATAEKKISQKAESIAKNAGRQVTEGDMVEAFFAETPFGFHGPMKSDMQELGIDYAKYGYEK